MSKFKVGDTVRIDDADSVFHEKTADIFDIDDDGFLYLKFKEPCKMPDDSTDKKSRGIYVDTISVPPEDFQHVVLLLS